MTSSLNVLDVSELDPIRESLLRCAHDDAESDMADAEREAASVIARATAEAAQLLDQARAQAAVDIAGLEAAERSRVLRTARSVQLQTQRTAYEALMSAATESVRDQLADDPEVVSSLSRQARTEFGPHASLTRLPDGGLVAEAGGRRLALPLQALVERTVGELIASRESP